MISTCASMRGGWIYVSIINVSTSVFLIDTFFTAIYQSTFYRHKTVPSKVAERHKSYIFCPNTASQALCVATPFHISHEGGHMMIEIDTPIIKQLYHFSGENMAHPCLWGLDGMRMRMIYRERISTTVAQSHVLRPHSHAISNPKYFNTYLHKTDWSH